MTIANDTGSDIQIILPEDLAVLLQGVVSLPVHDGHVLTAGGIVRRIKTDIEIQITKEDGTPMTEWFSEKAIIGNSGDDRLSGSVMRNHLYFATAPGNTRLYIAAKKHGITSQLPVV